MPHGVAAEGQHALTRELALEQPGPSPHAVCRGYAALLCWKALRCVSYGCLVYGSAPPSSHPSAHAVVAIRRHGAKGILGRTDCSSWPSAGFLRSFIWGHTSPWAGRAGLRSSFNGQSHHNKSGTPACSLCPALSVKFCAGLVSLAVTRLRWSFGACHQTSHSPKSFALLYSGMSD